MAFCGHCGSGVPDGQRFCASCGTPQNFEALHPSPSAESRPPAEVGPSTIFVPSAESGPSRWMPSRLAGRSLVFATLALALVVAAGVVGLRLLNVGSATATGWAGVPWTLEKAVKDRPDEVWTWESPGDSTVSSVLGVDDETLVSWSGDNGTGITALDHKGEKVWSRRGLGGLQLSQPGPGPDNVVLALGEEGGGSALSVQSGQELWELEDRFVVGAVDAGLIASDEDGGVALLDAQTGKRIWSEDSKAFAVYEDAVYLADEGELRRVRLSDGKEVWSIDNDASAGDGSISVAAGSGTVIVTDEDELFASATGDGGEQWTEQADGDPQGAGQAPDDKIWVATSTTDDDTEDTSYEVKLYDSKGERESESLGNDYFYGSLVNSGGKEYLLDYGSQTLFEDKLHDVGSVDGTITPVDSGFYSLDKGKLSFTEYGADEKSWDRRLGTPDEVQLAPANGAVLGYEQSTVTRYE